MDQPVETSETIEGDETGQKMAVISHPDKLIRIASMTRAMLEEARNAPLDPADRERLARIYRNTVDQICSVLSDDLREEFADVSMPPLSETPTVSELRIAQAQLIGWLEGLFNGIQAALMSQALEAKAQLQKVQGQEKVEKPGHYL